MTDDLDGGNVTPATDAPPLAAWFLGPKAEHSALWEELLSYIFQDYVHWRRNYFPHDPAVISRLSRREPSLAEWTDDLMMRLDSVLNELKAHYPFFSPRSMVHLPSEQTLPSVLGSLAGMLYNPNNTSDEIPPVTMRLELEVGKMVAEMLGFNARRSWAHLCSGGTVANLEALWIARFVQFIPFMAKEFCDKRRIIFTIKTPDGREVNINDLDHRELIQLKSNESIFMFRKLARYLVDQIGGSPSTVVRDINTFIQSSSYNPNRRGIHAVLQTIGLSPLIFVAASAHPSIKKAANILGYGEDCVQPVPVDAHFRLDVEHLRSQLLALPDDRYVAAVVGTVGTSDEGAVDPIHQLKSLRDQLGVMRNQSFWLHVDAAWGGYIASMFRGHGLSRKQRAARLDDLCEIYQQSIAAREKFSIELWRTTKQNAGVQIKERRSVQIDWSDDDVYKAILSLPSADSITVDPHKLGYVPYPAGIVAFRNGLLTELIAHDVRYVSEAQSENSIDEPIDLDEVGPYIVEGSKPGAAAAACWLAHKTIPLSAAGHGAIIRASLLSAQKLFKYLHYHRFLFQTFQRAGGGDPKFVQPFTFIPLVQPDTNVVCFIAVPMAWKDEELVPIDVDVQRVNLLNRRIYERLASQVAAAGRWPTQGERFFISCVSLTADRYSSPSIKQTLQWLRIAPRQYDQHGLFVLRSTITNPLYNDAERQGKGYFYDFVKHLHDAACMATQEVFGQMQPVNGP